MQINYIRPLYCRLHKSEDTYTRRFQVYYNSSEINSACGGTYSNKSGLLMSPSYPDPYPDLSNCIYLISQPNGTYVSISFISLDIVCQEVGSASDFIEIRDGNSEDSPMMGKFCGNSTNIPSIMTSTTNYLRVR